MIALLFDSIKSAYYSLFSTVLHPINNLNPYNRRTVQGSKKSPTEARCVAVSDRSVDKNPSAIAKAAQDEVIGAPADLAFYLFMTPMLWVNLHNWSIYLLGRAEWVLRSWYHVELGPLVLRP